MDSSDYFVLELSQVTSLEEDLLVGDLFEMGAQGVQENLDFHQMDRKYQPEVIEKEVKNLIAYFITSPHSSDIEALQKKYSSVELSMNKHPIKDWLSEWKKQWKAFELIDDIWVVPEWEKQNFDATKAKPIYIEPGMAFGTGTHETTQIAAKLLCELLDRASISSFTDVGTGSGILAILARLKGVERIIAYDNDPESKRVFFENIEKNNMENFEWSEFWQDTSVDLTLANIIDGVLLDLKPFFKKTKSSHYIFTGILAEREESFLKEMTQDWSLKTLQRMQKGDWVGFCFEAPR